MDGANSGELKFTGRFIVEAFRDGERLWTEKGDFETDHNIVVNEGIQFALDTGLAGAWYVALLGNITPSSTDTLSTIAATEVTAYTGTRPLWNKTRTNQTLSNSASTADFTINADSTIIYGGFLASVNSGSVGTLLAAKQFTGGSKTLDTNDQIKITYEIVGSST